MHLRRRGLRGEARCTRCCWATRASSFAIWKSAARSTPTKTGSKRSSSPDAHHSVFEIPLAERRRHLLAVDWVRTALIERIWPNRIVVTITERMPVAFAKLPIAGSLRHWLALIDEEGILLSIPPKVRFRLPVLSGVSEDQTDDERRLRVESMQHLLADLGPQAKDISEINAASAQDMRVIANVEEHAWNSGWGISTFARVIGIFSATTTRSRAIRITRRFSI